MSRPRIRWHNPLGLRKKALWTPRKRRRFSWRRFGRLIGVSAAGLSILTVVLFAWYARDLPTPGKIRKYQAAEATQIFDRNGTPLYAVFDNEKRISIGFEKIPDSMKHATIAVEDKDFYKHFGIDVRGLVRGLILKPLQGQRAQGGSTITQQYVKNALLSPDRTLDRKIKEMILSLELEALYSKDEILALYLNEIPYGSNAYGIEAAAQTFFGKSATELTVTESAALAALPQRPTYLSPYGNHLDDLLARKDFILDRMTDEGYISRDEAAAAKAATIEFIPRREHILAPHFVFYVRDLLVEKYGERLVLEGGLKVTTTLDSDAQLAAETAIATAADRYLSRYNAQNAALAAVDPQTGQVLAMVGSIDYFDTENQGNFNVATAARQPGSSFKPIVYATGFKGGWAPSSTLWDVETDFGKYTPQNFDGRFRGPVTIRSALANSLNIPAVKMLALAGIDESIQTAEDFGITTLTDPDRYGLSLVLGGAEVTPLELAAAYGVFGADGTYHPTTPILKVEDAKGRVLEEWKDQPREALAPEIAYQITSILSDNEARAPVFGTNSPLFFENRQVAVKTGTTSEYRDGWTVGYTPTVTAAVWVGNNDNTPMDKAGGVRAAGPIFHEFITGYFGDRASGDFARPATIREQTVAAFSGKIPSSTTPDDQKITDLFAPWQIPAEYDDVFVRVRVNRLNGKLATALTPPDLVEERTYVQIHSERPHDSRWEDPVRAWAASLGYHLENPPAEHDDYRADQLPTLTITNPTDNEVVTDTLAITTVPTSSVGIRQVAFAIDGVTIDTITAAPWQTIYDASKLVAGNHELVVTVTDVVGATARQSLVFMRATDTTPPQPVTNLRAEAQGLGSVKLSWKNPSESDLAAVRIYRSTVAGQLGSLVLEIATSANRAETTVLSGQSTATTYYYAARPIDRRGNEDPTLSQTSVLAL
ncbi:PBP1A family penicillin-binding protein [Candidatus Berkelbacteria bacterium]|nr:PBP1A family penicillin-binding protein [Candidatus Berkelbacteria bacterium]